MHIFTAIKFNFITLILGMAFALISGYAIGYFLRKLFTEYQIKEAEERRNKILEEAQKEVENRIKAAEIEGKERPLCFRRWWKEAPMKIGTHNIPVTDNTERVTVNAIIVPMLGFDTKGYRLGYGAGYYDRTISGMTPRPLLIGVAFEILRLEDIYPRPHDVAMDFIVTEAGIFQVSKQGISRISTDKCALENS